MSFELKGFAVMAAVALSTVPLRAEDMPPPCRSRMINVEHANYAPKSDAVGSTLCAQGRLRTIRLEMRETTIATGLSALSTVYNVSFHSSIALNEARDGTYAGSLGQVISHLLDGYNYVIKHHGLDLDVTIFDKKGEQPVSAPTLAQFNRPSDENRAQVSRSR
jgi:hypothetical protein